MVIGRDVGSDLGRKHSGGEYRLRLGAEASGSRFAEAVGWGHGRTSECLNCGLDLREEFRSWAGLFASLTPGI